MREKVLASYLAGVDAPRQTAARAAASSAAAAYAAGLRARRLAAAAQQCAKRRRLTPGAPGAPQARWRFFGSNPTVAAVRLIQFVFRRFNARDGIATTLARMRALKADPSTQSAAEWSAGMDTKKDAMRNTMRVLSRVCCRRIRLSTGMGAADTALLMGPHRCNPMCPVAFADAFFIAAHTSHPHLPFAEGAWGEDSEADRIELHAAVSALGASTDRFMQLSDEQQSAFKAAGARLAESFKAVVAELSAGGQPSLRSALVYEMAVGSFRLVYRQFTHAPPPTGLFYAMDKHYYPAAHPGSPDDAGFLELFDALDSPRTDDRHAAPAPAPHDAFELSGLQAGINALLRELSHTLDRMLKRSRVVAAIGRAPCRLQAMQIMQEQQMAKLAQHARAKLGELTRVLGGEPLPLALLGRIRDVFIMSLSAVGNEKGTRDATLMVIELLILHGKAQSTPTVFFEAAACMLAATAPDQTTAVAFSEATVDAFLTPPLSLDEIAVDAWVVVGASLRRGHTGAAAFLLADVNKALMMAGIYCESQHALAFGRNAAGELHADPLLSSPHKALEIMGPFLSALGDPTQVWVAMSMLVDECSYQTTGDAQQRYNPSLTLMTSASALADLVLLFLKSVSASAAGLRRRAFDARMLLLCQHLDAS